jgi:penicillin amidase
MHRLVKPLDSAARSVLRSSLRRLSRPLLGRSLPQLEGRTELSGLGGQVEVLRDRYGVPQIFAESEPDLFFAQGYVHAQDRLLQLELGRRTAAGRLSELFGHRTLPLDRLSRTVAFARIAERSLKGAPAEVLKVLEAYSAGVTACIRTGPLPPSLRALGRGVAPWTPRDTAAWSLVLAWGLSASWEPKLHRLGRAGNGTGSNAWAVAPGRSASGAAMLAADPHLFLVAPCQWYEVGLYGGRYSVVGGSIPGAPGVAIGHNEHLAWSVTAAFTDVQDLYLERFAPDGLRYEHEGAWLTAEVREEHITVRGRREPVLLRVRETIHGPVASDLLPESEEDLALRWAEPDPLKLVESGLAIDRARDRRELLEALRLWQAPNQNFVFAERGGGVGRALAGLVPVRRGHNGESPVPGWDGEHEWEGYLPPEKLPVELDPEVGFVASANDDPGDERLPGSYLPFYRKDRIENLLRATDGHTPETFRRMQGDLHCAPALTLARRLARLPVPEGLPKWAHRELGDWDGWLSAETRPGALARVALEILVRRTTDDLPRIQAQLPTGIETYLSGLVPELVGELERMPEGDLRSAYAEAVGVLARKLGGDPRTWSWGALHEVRFAHPLGVAGLLRGVYNRGPYPAGGDANTICLAAFGSGRPGRLRFGPATTGPSYRFVVDTGDWEGAWSVLVPGQSGHPASRHYDDQIDLWREVRYRPMVYGRGMAEAAVRYRLVLAPVAP